jgi:hypothetical protein
MIDMDAWAAAGAGLLGTAAAAVNLGSLLRCHLRQRARVQLERERSARSIARTAGFAQMLHRPHTAVRMVERDIDGERVIEIGRRDRTNKEAA